MPFFVNLYPTLESDRYTTIEHLGGYFSLLKEENEVLIAGIKETAKKGVYNCATLAYIAM